MCGIAGIMTLDGTAPSEAVLSSFETSMAHRGPDGVGRFCHKNVPALRLLISKQGINR